MKNARHQMILELVRNHHIETQEELADLLKDAGFQVTQATVSRDIRQLQLRKVSGGGRQHYDLPSVEAPAFSDRYRRVLRDAYVSLDISINIAVIKTVSGMAMAAAAALDSLGWDEILGCIAGDDTIFCVMRSIEDGEVFKSRINKIVSDNVME